MAGLLLLLAPAALALSNPVRLPVQLETSILRVAARHCANAPPASLAEYLGSQSPLSLARGLARNLPPGTLRVSAPEGDSNVLMVEFDRRVDLGPAALNLWMQPRIVVWLRMRGKSILVQGHLCGVGSSDEAVRIPFLNLRSKFTAVEGPLAHLQGDSVPCLLLSTALKAEVEMCLAKGWKRWLPRALLLRLASRRLLAEFQRLHEAIAAGLIAEYEACRAEWLAPPPVRRIPAVAE
eukprot:scaffold11546_cov129-Isochrysis_galbana.AAC.3